MTTKSKYKRGVIKSSETDGQVSHWNIPDFGTKGTRHIPTVEETQKDIESLREAARKEGYQAGLEEGLKKGEEKAYKETKVKVDERMQAFDLLLACFEDPIRDFSELIEIELLGLLKILFRVCLEREIQMDPDVIVTLIEAGLEHLPLGEEKKYIYMSPDDKKVFDALWEEHGNGLTEKYGHIVFGELDTLTRGEIKIVTKHSTIDGTIEARMRNLLNADEEEPEGTRRTRIKPPESNEPESGESKLDESQSDDPGSEEPK